MVKPPPPRDLVSPRVGLRRAKQKLRLVLRHGYVLGFTTSEKGSARATLGRLAKGTMKVKKAGRNRFVLKFTRRAKKRYAHARRLTVRLVLIVKDRAGNATRKSAWITLRR